MFEKLSTLKNGEQVLIRSFSASDVVPLHRMYSSLSEQSRFFFNPAFFIGTFGPKWFLSNLSLLLAVSPAIRRVLVNLWPKTVSPSLVVVNARGELVGFAYIIFGKTMGNCIRDDYQNRGLGTRLGFEIIALAKREGIRELYGWVLSENTRAIRVARKHGFKAVHLVKERYRGKEYDTIIMKQRL